MFYLLDKDSCYRVEKESITTIKAKELQAWISIFRG